MQQVSQELVAYPKIYFMLKIYVTPDFKECLNTLSYLALKGSPSLVVVVEGQPHHARLLWGIELLPVSLYNTTSHDGKICTLSQDVVEGTLPPTIKITPTWWELQNCPVVSAATVSQVL